MISNTFVQLLVQLMLHLVRVAVLIYYPIAHILVLIILLQTIVEYLQIIGIGIVTLTK